MNELVAMSISRYPWVGAALLLGFGIVVAAVALTFVAIVITAGAARDPSRRRDARKVLRVIGELVRLGAEAIRTLRAPNE